MKKILLLSILSISLFSLSGCNEQKQNTTDTAGKSSASTEMNASTKK